MKYETYETYRNVKGLTDTDVQKKLGISQQYIWGWKNNQYQPKPEKAIPIANLLDIPIEVAVSKE